MRNNIITSFFKKLVAMAKRIITKLRLQSLLFKKVNYVNDPDAELSDSQVEGARKQFPVGGDKQDDACLTADEVTQTYSVNGKNVVVTPPEGYSGDRIVPEPNVRVDDAGGAGGEKKQVTINAEGLSARLYARVISTSPADEYDGGSTDGTVYGEIAGLPKVSGVKAKVSGYTPVSPFPYYQNESKYAEYDPSTSTAAWELQDSGQIDIRNTHYVPEWEDGAEIDMRENLNSWSINILSFTGAGVSNPSKGVYIIETDDTIYTLNIPTDYDITIED